MALGEYDLDPIIVQVTTLFKLDPALIRAMVQVESGGKCFSNRYEPAFTYFKTPKVYAEKLGITALTEQMNQATSWGPLQIMGVVAREMGFDDHLPKLCVPEAGIFFSCKKLKTLFDKYETEDDVIAAYNAGSPRRGKDKNYINQVYVDKVHWQLKRFRGLTKT